jgi:hypothetical protein
MWRSWLSNFLGSLRFHTVSCQCYRTLTFYEEWVSMEHLWNVSDGGGEYSEKTLFNCHYVHCQSCGLAGIDLAPCGERLTTNCLCHGTKAWHIYLIKLRVNFWGHIVHDSLLWWYRAVLTEVRFGRYTGCCMWRAPFCSSAQMAGARLPMHLNYALWFLMFVGCLWNVHPAAPGFCRNVL